MRRGQMEMVGLVFIVIILVVGIVLYLRFSIPDQALVGETEMQSITSFLIALKETTIPECRASFERVVGACLRDETLCTSRDPCSEAQTTMEEIADAMLPRQGYRYNLSVAGTDLQISDDCNSADRTVELITAPHAPIVYAGVAQRDLILAICR